MKDIIKAEAKKKGLDIVELSAKLGTTHQNLYRMLKNPKFSTLERIAYVLGIPATVFFTEYTPYLGDFACPHCGKSLKLYINK